MHGIYIFVVLYALANLGCYSIVEGVQFDNIVSGHLLHWVGGAPIMSSCPHHTSCRSPGPQVSYSLCQALTFMGYYPPFRIFNERNHHLPFCHDNVVEPRGHKIRNTVIWFSDHIKRWVLYLSKVLLHLLLHSHLLCPSLKRWWIQ